MGRSLAIWYERAAAGSSPASAELQFNLFRRRIGQRGNVDENFLDIGLRISSADQIGGINIYIPAQISLADVSDLAGVLQNRRTLMALFNEDFTPRGAQGAATFEILDSSAAPIMDCHRLRVGDFALTSHAHDDGHHGSVLRLGAGLCGRFSRQRDNYVRFRLTLDAGGISDFATAQVQQDRILVSSFRRDEVVDCRVNERRSLPAIVLDVWSHGSNQLFEVKALHYFLIREVDWDLVIAERAFHKVRLMEEDLWTEYLQHTGRPWRQTMIYHWRNQVRPDAPAIHDFNAIAKFRRTETGLRTIAIYVGVIITIGVIGNLIAALAYDKVPALFKSKETIQCQYLGPG